MLESSLCGDSAPGDSRDKGYFRSFRTAHSSHRLREGASPELVRYNMGHANISVTQRFTARAGGNTEGMRPAIETVPTSAQYPENVQRKHNSESVINQRLPH